MKLKSVLASMFILGSLVSLADKGYKQEAKRLFGTSQVKYRIPSLLVTNTGRVLVAADNRYNQHSDWNNIDTVVKWSDDLGETFSDELKIMDLADSPSNHQQKSAFLIDPSMLNNDGEILMIIDMFPKSRGFFSVANAPAGTGYKRIGDVDYRILTRHGYTNKYLVDPEGNVYEEVTQEEGEPILNKQQGMSVKLNPTEQPFKILGDIYQDGIRIGNIFRGKNDNSEQEGRDYDGEYLVNTTAYLWLTKSNDNGETWSTPVDLSPMIKKDHISFLGTGPGIGIKLKHGEHAGRLLFPVYYTHNITNNGRRDDGSSQQSAMIYSDDNGQTWELGESIMEGRIVGNNQVLSSKTPKLGGYQLTESQVVELNSGTLKLFMRGFYNSVSGTGGIHIGTSYDGGQTWEDTTEQFPFPAPYSQVAAIHYGEIGGEEFIVVSAPSNRSSRVDGMLHLGKVLDNDEIEWVGKRVYKPGTTQYSSIGKLPDGDIAVAYEVEGTAIDYTRMSIDWIAPNYVFKDFLPYQKKFIKQVHSNNITEYLFNIQESSKLENLYTKESIIKYDISKPQDNIRHNVEFQTPIFDYVGLYGKFSIIDKDMYSGAGIYGYYNHDRFDISQTLGIESINANKKTYNVRGWDIALENSSVLARLKTDIRVKAFKNKYFRVEPTASIDQYHGIWNKSKAINQDKIELDLKANKFHSVNFKFGLEAGYNYKGVDFIIGVNSLNKIAYHSNKEDKVFSYKNEIEMKANLGYSFNNNFKISADIRYLGDLRHKMSGVTKYGLEISKKW